MRPEIKAQVKSSGMTTEGVINSNCEGPGRLQKGGSIDLNLKRRAGFSSRELCRPPDR